MRGDLTLLVCDVCHTYTRIGRDGSCKLRPATDAENAAYLLGGPESLQVMLPRFWSTPLCARRW